MNTQTLNELQLSSSLNESLYGDQADAAFRGSNRAYPWRHEAGDDEGPKEIDRN